MRIEPVLLLLTILVLAFCGMLFAAEHWFVSDSQLFQVISGLVTGFSGALLMRVKPRSERGDPGTEPDTTTTVTTPTATVETKS